MSSILIVTPFYNSFPNFYKTFESVLNQTFTNYEWIIVDDASSLEEREKLLALVKEYNHIRVIFHDQNMGAGEARNTGLKYFSHTYLTFIDSDDYWDSNFLERMIALQQKTQCRIVFSGYRRFVEKESRYIAPYYFEGRVSAVEILKGNPISCLATIIKPDKSKTLPMFGSQIMRNDLVFFYRALNLYDSAIGVTDVLATYVMRSNSLSRNKLKALSWQWKVCREEAGLSRFKSARCVCSWAIYGLKKYRD